MTIPADMIARSDAYQRKLNAHMKPKSNHWKQLGPEKPKKKPNQPKKESELEIAFLNLLKLFMPDHPEPKREYRFHNSRMWRFDFAWPDKNLAVEIEGGIYVNGGHNRGKAYQGNCDKYNAAIVKGWRVLRFTTDDLNKCPKQTMDIVKQVYGEH